MAVCNTCGDTGIVLIDCDACEGSGSRTLTCQVCDGSGLNDKKEKCQSCNGTGEIYEEYCSVCYGQGQVPIDCPDCKENLKK